MTLLSLKVEKFHIFRWLSPNSFLETITIFYYGYLFLPEKKEI